MMGANNEKSGKNMADTIERKKKVGNEKGPCHSEEAILDVDLIDQLDLQQSSVLSPNELLDNEEKEAGEHEMGEDNSHSEFDAHVDRCLSVILHFEEVQEIAEIIKRIHRELGSKMP
jgi:hypothetical protein